MCTHLNKHIIFLSLYLNNKHKNQFVFSAIFFTQTVEQMGLNQSGLLYPGIVPPAINKKSRMDSIPYLIQRSSQRAFSLMRSCPKTRLLLTVFNCMYFSLGMEYSCMMDPKLSPFFCTQFPLVSSKSKFAFLGSSLAKVYDTYIELCLYTSQIPSQSFPNLNGKLPNDIIKKHAYHCFLHINSIHFFIFIRFLTIHMSKLTSC